MPKSKPSRRAAAYPSAADLAILLGTAAKLTPVKTRKLMRSRRFKREVEGFLDRVRELAK